MRQGLLGGGGVQRDTAATPKKKPTCSVTHVARQGVPPHVCNYAAEKLLNFAETCMSAGTQWGYGLVAYGMAIFQSPKNIFQRPKFTGKCLEFRRNSDFRQISDSEI